MRNNSGQSRDSVDESRRSFLKGAMISLFSVALGSISLERFFVPTTRNVPVTSYDGKYPTAILVDPDDNPITASEIPYATPSSSSYPILVFNYPLQDEPNILIRLRNMNIPQAIHIKNSSGGIDSITAYSGICQHLGCTVPLLDYHPGNSIPFEAQLIGYNKSNWPTYGLLYCKCHGSQYNPVEGPHNLYNSGPAPSPANHSLPQVLFYHDTTTDYIYAIGMNPVNAVIRTHLWQPNGEVYGPEVVQENLSGGSALPYDDSLGNYKTVVVSSSNFKWSGRF